VNANIELKSQVIEGPSAEGKVIAGASQFITEFNGAALLILDPRTKEWGGQIVMPHGARLALSINAGGMMVLGADPSVCKGGAVSVMPSVERVCAELIRREAAGSGRHIKDVMGTVADLIKATSVPVRKKEAHNAAKLGSKVVHSEQGQTANPWSCRQHETSDATSGSDSDESFSTPAQPLSMDPDDAISAVVETEVSAFCSNLEAKFANVMVGMKVQPVGAVAAAQESAAAQLLVHQVQQALADRDADVEHSLLEATPEAAVKLQELEVQVAQKTARDAQAEKERQTRISSEFAALKAEDTAEISAKLARQDFDHIGFENADMRNDTGYFEEQLKRGFLDAMFLHGKSTCYDYKNFNNWFHQHQLGKMMVTDTLSDELKALMAEDSAPTVMAAVADARATGSMDERIAALQQMAAKSKQMMREQAVLNDAMTTLGAALAAERSGVASPSTPSSPRRRDAAVELGVESQHALLHAAGQITRESLSSGGVSPVGQDFKDCRICAATKMRAPSVCQDSGPRPDTAAAIHVCSSLGRSAGPSCEAAPSQ
jgi:hypothetical protein